MKKLGLNARQDNFDKAVSNRLNTLGLVLAEQGCLDEAVNYFREAIKLDPDFYELHHNLGEVLAKQDKLNEAISSFRKSVTLNPTSAWCYMSLGEAIAKKGWCNVAINCYRKALEINPQEVKLWQEAQEIQVHKIDHHLIDNPVFIVGCGHSGTSLMLAILDYHPSFFSISYESTLFMKSHSKIQETLHQWDTECIRTGYKRWIEKTPVHIFYIRKILLYRPKSKFILMLRDGRDVVCSLQHREEYKSFQKRLNRWIYDNKIAFPYWEHPNLKIIKYEDIVLNPEATIRDILSFLEEEYYQNISIDFYKNKKYWYSNEITRPKEVMDLQDHQNLRNWQINQPIFDGRGRWKKEMDREQKNLFKQQAQEYLVKFGYVEDADW